MSDERRFLPFEEKLQAEAQRLMVMDCQPTSARLWSEYRRRQRHRIVQKCATTMLTLLVAVVLGAKFSRWGAMPDPKQGRDGNSMVATLPSQKSVGSQRDPSQTPGRALTAVVTFSEDGHPVIAIPFAMGDPASGEEVISGFYVPEQVEPIDLNKLAPAERDAVRTMLGIEGSTEEGTTESKTI